MKPGFVDSLPVRLLSAMLAMGTVCAFFYVAFLASAHPASVARHTPAGTATATAGPGAHGTPHSGRTASGTAGGESTPYGSPRSARSGPAASLVKLFAYVPGPITSVRQVDSETARLRPTPAYGISWKFAWSTLEPQDGVFDWSLVDRSIQDARGIGKTAMLRVIAGIDSPGWIDRKARTITFSNSQLYTPSNYPSRVVMPIPWDPTYLHKWEQFIAAFGHRYNANPSVWSVQMAGGGYIGEMTLPAVYSAWAHAGFSDAAITRAWDSIIDAFRLAFPTTATNLDIDQPLSQGHSNALPGILGYVLHRYPGMVYLQQNGLRAVYAQYLSQLRQDIRGAADVTVVGYQMYGGSGSVLSAGTGDRMTAFKVAVSDHAGYLEVYDTDLLNPRLSGALHYIMTSPA